MISAKVFIRIAVCTMVVSAMLLGGCGKKSEEKMAEEKMENMLKKATGKDVDVNIQGKGIKIEGQDSKAQISETSVWPPEMFEDVPKFTSGKIEHVTKTQEGSNQTFNIFFVDIDGNALKNYAAALNEKGWQTQILDMGKGGMISAQKDKLSMNFSFNSEDKKGLLGVFSAQ
ncbi:MAG: hypothetical protein C0403_07670 [Desulfobacterium sp.]|nr:hypothetical protein [Desulfobacterium sp.]